mgnify:CR=1 FL=1
MSKGEYILMNNFQKIISQNSTIFFIVGVGPIFRFAMVDMVLGGGSKCTKRPSKSAYLEELGLSFTEHQKLLKKST